MTAQPNCAALRKTAIPKDLALVRAFAEENQTGLREIMDVVGGEALQAEVRRLLVLLAKPTSSVEMVRAILTVMREMLSAAGPRVDPGYPVRPDLDGAILWYGARLDELIAGLEQRRLRRRPRTRT